MTEKGMFDSLLNNADSCVYNPYDHPTPKSIPKRYEKIYQKIASQIFPTTKEDSEFFKSIWEEIKSRYFLWELSATQDGMLFSELMENEISFKGFMIDSKDKNFLAKTRERMYMDCFDFQEGDEWKYDTFVALSNVYRSRELELFTNKFHLHDPLKFMENCAIFYSKMGYELEDGVASNPDSAMHLAAEGKVQLTPQTFNLCLLPWLLEEQGIEELEDYGWQPDEIKNAILEFDGAFVRAALDKMTIYELVSLYRVLSSSDCYIDWDLVKEYQFLSLETLYLICDQTFKVKRDLLEGPVYKEVADRLKTMSDKTMKITENAEKVIAELEGFVSGEKKSGFSYLLSTNSEGENKSFWHPDISGRMNLFYEGQPIPRSQIPLSFETYNWACKGKDQVSIGYLIMIVQALGLWDLVRSYNEEITRKNLCKVIDMI